MIETSNQPSLSKSLAPADTAAVAEAVREAAKEGRAVYPRGGGTSWDYGARPWCATAGLSSSAVDERSTFNCSIPPLQHSETALLDKPAVAPGVVFSLEKLNRLVDHAAEDMTVTVEAGMTFAELAKILAAKNQRLPIDVPQPEKATLGGLVAVNQAGPRQFGYGTIKDYLLGFTAVDGAGTIFHGGGRVVKNAAGYNMTRLMAGSLGTLGILTQLTFMVRPLPELSAIVACDLPDLETAEKLLADLNRSQVRPVAVELLSRVRACTHHSGSYAEFVRASTHPTTLIVGFEGTAAEVRWMLDTLQAEWNAVGGLSLKTVTDEAAEKLWHWLAGFSADARITVWPSQVVELIAALREKFPGCTVQSHAMSGIVLVKGGRGKAEGGDFYQSGATAGSSSSAVIHQSDPALLDKPAVAPTDNDIEYYRQLRATAEAFGGKMTVLRYPDHAELSREDVWGPPPEGFSVMRSLKERFDPHNILNRGRFIFE
jgi:glycolate oxidase FAD binding subunit